MNVSTTCIHRMTAKVTNGKCQNLRPLSVSILGCKLFRVREVIVSRWHRFYNAPTSYSRHTEAKSHLSSRTTHCRLASELVALVASLVWKYNKYWVTVCRYTILMCNQPLRPIQRDGNEHRPRCSTICWRRTGHTVTDSAASSASATKMSTLALPKLLREYGTIYPSP